MMPKQHVPGPGIWAMVHNSNIILRVDMPCIHIVDILLLKAVHRCESRRKLAASLLNELRIKAMWTEMPNLVEL